jgi:hypothetical protein
MNTCWPKPNTEYEDFPFHGFISNLRIPPLRKFTVSKKKEKKYNFIKKNNLMQNLNTANIKK